MDGTAAPASGAAAPVDGVTASAGSVAAPAEARAEVTYYGSAESPISAAVAIPAGRALYWTNGTVPPVADESSPSGTRARYGDMETQATGVLERLRAGSPKRGSAWRTSSTPASTSSPTRRRTALVDYRGWFSAYAKFFGTEENPVKPARSTVGVAGLVSPDWLVEIEAFAAYPE